MAVQAVNRRIEIVGVSKGLDTLERDVRAVESAQNDLATSSEASARVTETSARRQMSAAGSYERLRKQIDETYRVQRRLEQGQRDLDRAFEQSVIDAQEYGMMLDKLRGHYSAANDNAQSLAARTHQLNMKFNEGYAAAKRLDAELGELAEAERLGVQITGGYAAAIDGLIKKHDAAAAAAARHAQEMRTLAEAERLSATSSDGQARWNSYSGVARGVAKSAQDAAAVFEAELDRIDEIARQKGEQAGQNFQRALNASFGIGVERSSARASAAVFEEVARASEELEARVIALRGQLDPAGAALQRLDAELAEYSAMAHRGAISSTELAKAQTLAKARYNETTAAINQQAAAMRRGAATFQTSNLASQGFDIASTAAFMPWYTVALQQGPHVAQVFNDVRESGGRIGPTVAGAFLQLINPISLVTIGVIGLTAAAIQWFSSSKNASETYDDALQKHAGTVEHLKKLYGEAALAAGNLASAGGDAFSSAAIRNDFETLRNVLKMQQQVMSQGLSGDGWLSGMLGGSGASIEMLRNLAGEQVQFKSAVDTFLESIRRGNRDLEGFRGNVDAIFSSLLAGSENPTELRATADAVLAIGESATTVTGKFAPFGDAINKLLLDFSEGKDSVVDFNREVSRIGAQDPSLQKIADEAIVLGQNIVKVTEALKEMERARFRAVEQTRDRLASERNDTGQSFYQERERQWELENRILDAQTQQIRALTDQERIAAAGAVARAQNPVEGEERRREVALAERQERERLDQRAREAAISRAREREDAARSAQEEISLIGKTASEVARLQFEYSELAALREEAAQTGRAIDGAEIAAIREKAQELGRYAEQVAAARAMDDLSFERDQLGRTREEREVYADIRRIGLDINSVEGSRVAEAIRVNQQLKEQEETARELASVFSDLFSGPIKDADDFFNKLTAGFARIGQANLDKAFESLFSGGASGLGSSAAASGKGGFLDQIGDWLGGIFSSRKVAAAQNKAITEAANKIPAKPLVDVIGKVGGSISSVTSNIGVSVEALASAIKSVESGGNYGALGPVTRSGDRAHGAYQVMGNNIAAWTKELTGSSSSIKEFLRDTSLQDRVAFQQLSKSLDKFGNWQDAASVWFSGQPLAKARTRSDGYNTTERYVAKVNEALGGSATFQDAVKQGAKIGVQDGIATVANTSASSAPQGGQSAGGGGLGGALGAGLSGFGTGFQAQDPMMGGLGGAISGFMSGGPPGLIVGAIGGILGGIFGRSRQKRQERKQAQSELESQMGAIRSLIDTAMGTPTGEYESAWRSMSDEIAKARKLASKAGDSALVKELDLANETFFNFLVKDWQRGLDGVIAAMESGHGMDSAFVRAQQAIIELQETLVGFVEDARFFAETGGVYENAKLKKGEVDNSTTGSALTGVTDDPKRYFDPISAEYRIAVERYKDELKKLDVNAILTTGTGKDTREIAAFDSVDALMKKMQDLGVVFDELGNILSADQVKERIEREKELQKSIREAQEAAREMALRQLTGAEEFTAIELEIQRLEGTAAGLQTTLEKLGMTSEEAADAIEKGLNQALEKLRDDYVKDLTRSINDLSGAGHINDVMDAMKLYEERLKDSKALGLDTSLAFTELTLSLREIAKEAELSGDDLKQLSKMFPSLAKILKGITPSADVAEAEARVERAKADLRAAYDAEVQVIETTISRLKNFIEGIEDFKASLKLDSQLSPLSPFDRLMEAQKRFQDVSAKALAGDETAMDDLEDVSRQYLEEARGYYASSEQYFAIFGNVQKILDQALSSAKGQLSVEEKSLSALEAQVGKLIDIDDSVMSVVDAINELKSAVRALDKLGGGSEFDADTYWSKDLKAFYAMLQMYKEETGSKTGPDQIAGVWKAFASASSGKELDLLARTYADLIKSLLPRGMQFGGIVGAYASGGIVGNGIYDRDSVLARYAGGGSIALAGGEFVTRATSVNALTAPALDYINRTGSVPGNDNSAIVAELRAVKAELAALRAGQAEQTRITAAGAKLVAEAVEEGAEAAAETGLKVGMASLARTSR